MFYPTGQFSNILLVAASGSQRVHGNEDRIWKKIMNSDHRERIMAAAKVIFAQCGFEKARIDDISIAASVSKGNVYNHFQDKQDLFYHVIKDVLNDDIFSITSNLLSLRSSASRLEYILSEAYKRVVVACKHNQLIYELWAMAGKADSIMHIMVASAHQKWRDIIKTILEERCNCDECNLKIDPDSAASIIMAILNGMIVNYRFGKDNGLEKMNILNLRLLKAISAM